MIERVFEYLEEIKNRRFEWGTHDCFTFTNEAWRRMHGQPWADPDWTGVYLDPYGNPVGLTDLAARFPLYRTIAAAVDARLRRVPGVPPRGALVASYAGEGRWRLGTAFGISLGLHAAFLGSHGVRYIDIDEISAGWVNRNDNAA